jgi:hypothetical protein
MGVRWRLIYTLTPLFYFSKIINNVGVEVIRDRGGLFLMCGISSRHEGHAAQALKPIESAKAQVRSSINNW